MCWPPHCGHLSQPRALPGAPSGALGPSAAQQGAEQMGHTRTAQWDSSVCSLLLLACDKDISQEGPGRVPQNQPTRGTGWHAATHRGSLPASLRSPNTQLGSDSGAVSAQAPLALHRACPPHVTPHRLPTPGALQSRLSQCSSKRKKTFCVSTNRGNREPRPARPREACPPRTLEWESSPWCKRSPHVAALQAPRTAASCRS